ncbi:MAG: isoprenylcysteine carboxylmethyltransferase family protein [Clostridia bacterium]|nr:isoprenylcysteine carboxylmethyltransferase family protein [Clostridia bacterium]MBQ8512555.1 isoprenylcysteine carboxylmethyltransferase family protein [Clostridia bacterium]
MKLLFQALTKFLAGALFVGLLLFLPAGTFDFPGAWLFLGLLFVPMLILGTVLLVKSPELLEKRLRHREKESTQRGVVAVTGVAFIASFILAGLDHRFHWTEIPAWLTVTASVLLLLSYAMYAEVMRENAYLSRTVEVQENQSVVSTGLYGIVRHPMYAATVVLFLAIPLVLGSWIAFVVMLVYPVGIAVRILNEEAVLTEGLESYAEYKTKVKWRLIPFVW